MVNQVRGCAARDHGVIVRAEPDAGGAAAATVWEKRDLECLIPPLWRHANIAYALT